MRRRWIRLILFAAGLAAVAGGFYTALRPRPVEVETAVVRRGPMAVTIDQEGVTRIRNVYAVSSPIPGYLDRPALEEGDPVRKDETVVAVVRPLAPPFLDERTRAEVEAAIEAARSAISVAEVDRQRVQSSLELARSDLSRAERLASSNTISDRALEKAANDVALLDAQQRSADATIRVRKAELASALAKLVEPGDAGATGRAQSCCIRLTSPIDGRILKVRLKSAQSVAAGTIVAEIGDPGKIEIVADLLSSDAVRVHPGSKAAVTDWGGDEPLSATVRRVEPAGFTKVSALGIEEQRVNVILDLDRPDRRLGDAFRVFVRIVAWSRGEVLRVPLGALFRTRDDWTVFRVNDGRVHLTRVTVGHMNGVSAEAVRGLEAGDRLVLYPGDTISDGTKVRERPLSVPSAAD